MKTRSDKRLPFPQDPRRVDVCLGHVEVGPECWTWTGTIDRRGYGIYQQNGESAWRAHRAVWTVLVGPIPDGLELDHLCRNPGCVNPDHLEPVTHAENMRRAALNKTACPQGHPYSGANVWYRSNGYRACKECNRERARLRRKTNPSRRLLPDTPTARRPPEPCLYCQGRGDLQRLNSDEGADGPWSWHKCFHCDGKGTI